MTQVCKVCTSALLIHTFKIYNAWQCRMPSKFSTNMCFLLPTANFKHSRQKDQ